MSRFNRKAYFILLGFFCFYSQIICAQDQRVADSLYVVYKNSETEGIEKLELLKNLAFNEREDIGLALEYAEELIRISELENNQDYLYSGYLQKGYKHRNLGDSEDALVAFFRCAQIAIELKNLEYEGTAYETIAGVYAKMENYENSQEYYDKAIELLRIKEDSISLAAALNNAGDAYFNNGKIDKALLYFNESGQIYADLDFEIGKAYHLGNVGMVYAEKGKDILAENNINQAILILEETKDYGPISVYLTVMSDIYLRKNDFTQALNYAQKSLELAQEYGLKEQISDANLKLFELYKQKGDFEESIVYLQNHYNYRDSILNVKAIEEMADTRTDYEVSKKQLEVDLLNNQKRTQRIVMYSLGLFLILAVVFYRKISKEKDRSDNLLLNILPSKTAKELKEKGKVKARKLDAVTVMFTDFQAFTMHSQNLSPEKLVKSVDYFFSAFDNIIEKHGLEKIKTIGDAYMCAGGLVSTDPMQPIKVIDAAFEIIDFVQRECESDSDEIAHFNVRIGINTGPVVGGVVGTKKFAYDIWGDTVNVAARMETNSKAGHINISENTYQLVKDRFECTYRGEIDVKNKGMMKMYFVERAIEKRTA